ncbi:MAG: hypothetical protein ABIY37_09100 [Devosia sp.]
MYQHEGYHTAMTWEIDEGETGPREPREELPYDLPWRVLAVIVLTVGAIGSAVSLVIDLLK